MHVGQLVEKVAFEKRMSQKQIAELLNKVPSAVGHIYKRESIDTALLIQLGDILDHDFFYELSKESGLKPTPPQSQTREAVVKDEPVKVPITVLLDGTNETLTMWISKLTAINAAF